jgi:anion-transporting  ArsA/GET3 family ATPase
VNAADFLNAADFFAASRVLIVAGKGGVGKTTVGATLGIAAASVGLRTQLIELDGHSSLGSPFGLTELPYEEVEIQLATLSLAGRLSGRRITPDDALVEYLRDHGLKRIGGRLVKTGAIDVVSTAAPGIHDLLALGKIRALEQSGESDLIIVDAPAAGHALTFLRSPAGLADAVGDGPIREQAEQVLEMLGDDRRCQVMLVTLPEETPVSEAIETAYSLEDDVGLKLAPMVVNGILSPIDGLGSALSTLRGRTKEAKALRAAARYRQARREGQVEGRDRLSGELPLDQIGLTQLSTAHLDEADIHVLAAQFNQQISQLVDDGALGIGTQS